MIFEQFCFATSKTELDILFENLRIRVTSHVVESLQNQTLENKEMYQNLKIRCMQSLVTNFSLRKKTLTIAVKNYAKSYIKVFGSCPFLIDPFQIFCLGLQFTEIHQFTYNQFHNILRLFDVLPNFPFTTSETMGDCFLQTWYIRVIERLKTQDRRKLGYIRKVSKPHRMIAQHPAPPAK